MNLDKCTEGITCSPSCTNGIRCLPRNYDYPVNIDTIQVPVNGYVILSTSTRNAGTWIVHCHINAHVLSGMAMVFQIGGFGNEAIPPPCDPNGKVPSTDQSWSLGPYTHLQNEACPKPEDRHVI